MDEWQARDMGRLGTSWVRRRMVVTLGSELRCTVFSTGQRLLHVHTVAVRLNQSVHSAFPTPAVSSTVNGVAQPASTTGKKSEVFKEKHARWAVVNVWLDHAATSSHSAIT